MFPRACSVRSKLRVGKLSYILEYCLGMMVKQFEGILKRDSIINGKFYPFLMWLLMGFSRTPPITEIHTLRPY